MSKASNLKPLHYCNAARCRNLTRNRLCDKCQKETWNREAKQRQEQMDFYRSKEWKKLSKFYKAANPICEHPRCTQPAHTCDHINPIVDRNGQVQEHLKFDLENLQSLCSFHHQQKRAKERMDRYGNRKH